MWLDLHIEVAEMFYNAGRWDSFSDQSEAFVFSSQEKQAKGHVRSFPRNRQYRAEHLADIKERDRIYYADNREARLEYQRKYNAENRTAVLERKMRYREAHKDAKREYARRQRAAKRAGCGNE